MNRSRTSEQGNVLLTALILVGLVGLMATAYMKLASREHYLSARSQMWGSEIPIAEAGVEEAMTHINSGITNFGVNGWTLSGKVFARQRNLGDGYFYATISTALPPTLVSIGFGRIPTQTNYTQRTVMVTTRNGFPTFAILAKKSVDLNGGIHVDSYDSANPLYSTFGSYDPAKARDQARVGAPACRGGTTFGPSERVDDTGTGSSEQSRPRLAIARRGPQRVCYVVWEDDRNGTSDIYLARRDCGSP